VTTGKVEGTEEEGDDVEKSLAPDPVIANLQSMAFLRCC
jgi:hypothetical protein